MEFPQDFKAKTHDKYPNEISEFYFWGFFFHTNILRAAKPGHKNNSTFMLPLNPDRP